MTKAMSAKLVFLIPAILTIAMLLSACDGEPSHRLPETFTFNPGANFTTNINDSDPRRVIRCAVIFQVVDEAAVTELSGYTPVIRNAVLVVLGELTLREVTVDKDLHAIAQRIVDQANESLYGNVNLIVGAYFTEFVLA